MAECRGREWNRPRGRLYKHVDDADGERLRRDTTRIIERLVLYLDSEVERAIRRRSAAYDSRCGVEGQAGRKSAGADRKGKDTLQVDRVDRSRSVRPVLEPVRKSERGYRHCQ